MSVFHAEELSTRQIVRCWNDTRGIWVDDESDPGYIDEETFEQQFKQIN